MFATIWMWNHELSLIRRRTTALTFATCHQPLSSLSAFARSRTRRSLRLPRSGRRIRKLSTASEGDSRVSRSACWDTGPATSGSEGSVSGSSATAGVYGAQELFRRAARCRLRTSPLRGRQPSGRCETLELAADVRERLAEPPAVRLVVQPSAGPSGGGQRDCDPVVEHVALADRVGEPPHAATPARAGEPESDHERGA